MKNFLMIIVMMMFSRLIVAQDTNETTGSDDGIRLGLTLSPQLAWLNGGDKNLQSNGTYLGFSYGLLMDIVFKTNYAFSTGIIVSYDGGKLTYTESSKFNTYGEQTFLPSTNVDYRTQYLQVPLTMKLRTNQIGYITYFGQFGLQGGIRIRSRADISSSNTPLAEDKVDFSKDVTLPDLGLLIGGGFEYALTGNTALTTSLQFYNGFLDSTDNPEGYKSKSTLNHLRLQLGFYF